MNPFGYHLTDVALHIAVTVLVFAVVFLLTRGCKTVAWLSAVIFTTHPILVESVTSIATRQDIIASVFLLLSFAAFLLHASTLGRSRKVTMLSSVLFYALALGSKEIAILLPLIICAYLLFFPAGVQKYERNRAPSKNLLSQQLKLCLPYFVMTAIYLLWRRHVLGSIYVCPSPEATADLLCQITASYFADMLFPLPPNVGLSSPYAALAATACVFFMFLFITRKAARPAMRRSGGTDAGKLAAFLSVWLLLPLGLFLTTCTFYHRYMYVSIIPFSALLAITLAEGFRLFAQKPAVPQAAANPRWLPYAGAGSCILACGLVVNLLCFSPILKNYREVKDRSELSRIILEKLSKVVSDLPDQASGTLLIYDLPKVGNIFNGILRVIPFTFWMGEFQINSYLHLTNPDKKILVSVKSCALLPGMPAKLDLETTMQPENTVVVICKSR